MAHNKSGKSATLTDRQEKFVQGLIKGKSQREAYRAAYPNSVKWEDKTADERASRLFNDCKVNARYHFLHDRVIKEAEEEGIIDAKRVLQELANVAFANATDFACITTETEATEKDVRFIKKAHFYDTNTVPLEKRSALAEISETQNGLKIKQHDKVKALELLGKHLKLFTDKVDVGGGDTPIEVNITVGD